PAGWQHAHGPGKVRNTCIRGHRQITPGRASTGTTRSSEQHARRGEEDGEAHLANHGGSYLVSEARIYYLRITTGGHDRAKPLRPRRDLNPCYRRERPVSWASWTTGSEMLKRSALRRARSQAARGEHSCGLEPGRRSMEAHGT